MTRAHLIAPPYTGPTSVCRQCGNAGAATKCRSLQGLGTALTRTCNRCGFTWTERPAPPSSTTHQTGHYA